MKKILLNIFMISFSLVLIALCPLSTLLAPFTPFSHDPIPASSKQQTNFFLKRPLKMSARALCLKINPHNSDCRGFLQHEFLFEVLF